jgi:hypothetical protein
MPSENKQLNTRLPDSTLAQLEAVRAHLESERGYKVATAEALRHAIAQAAKALGKKVGKTSK